MRTRKLIARLRAPPIPSLGLSMPPNEFPLAVRIWLGIPSFPSTPALLCPCGSVIDPNGDHLLGCSHGPFRIRRHDAIRDIIYEALLLDNQSVKREQSASSQSRNRPGDIFHPDFSNGRPTYFDISVCNPLTPGNITSFTAGAAGLRGEAYKDAKHFSEVEGAGAVFIPLVTDALGLWSSFARKILKQIASKTIVFNNLSTAEALKYLIQRISTTLWSFNAKMLMQRLAILTV